MTASESERSAEERTAAARVAIARSKYGWVWPLTALNVIGVIFAIVGAVDEGVISYLFPQIWGFRTDFGIILGVIATVTILAVAGLKAWGGVDRADRWYRFYAWLTLASTIMFAVFLGGVLLLFALFFALVG